jgi:hypothetical protein
MFFGEYSTVLAPPRHSTGMLIPSTATAFLRVGCIAHKKTLNERTKQLAVVWIMALNQLSLHYGLERMFPLDPMLFPALELCNNLDHGVAHIFDHQFTLRTHRPVHLALEVHHGLHGELVHLLEEQLGLLQLGRIFGACCEVHLLFGRCKQTINQFKALFGSCSFPVGLSGTGHGKLFVGLLVDLEEMILLVQMEEEVGDGVIFDLDTHNSPTDGNC